MDPRMIARALRAAADVLDPKQPESAPKSEPSPKPQTPEVAPGPKATSPDPVRPSAVSALFGSETKTKTLTPDDLVPLLKKVAEERGQDTAIGLLGAHGIQRLSLATPEQLAALHEEITHAA